MVLHRFIFSIFKNGHKNIKLKNYFLFVKTKGTRLRNFLWKENFPYFSRKVKIMANVKLHDKEFKPYISNEEILKIVEKVAVKINKELKDKKPFFIGVLSGSFMFVSDLFRRINAEGAEIAFTRFASYTGTSSTGEIKRIMGLNEKLEGRTVIIVEDIVDTGHTIANFIKELKGLNPAEIKVATLLMKPNAYKETIPIDYVGIEIPNDFVVGYGLDYDGLGRNLPDLYVLA